MKKQNEVKTSSKNENIIWKTIDTYPNASLQEEAIKNGVNVYTMENPLY